jgi:hypothetical protein
MCAIPSSMDEVCAWIVVERAYTIHPLYARDGTLVAPPVILHPPLTGLAWQWGLGLADDAVGGSIQSVPEILIRRVHRQLDVGPDPAAPAAAGASARDG